MRYRVVFTLVTGFVLAGGRVSLGEAPTSPESGAASRQLAQTLQPAPGDAQSANATSSAAVTHWWERFAPPANAKTQAAAAAAQSTAPAVQTPSSGQALGGYFGKLLKGSDTKIPATDPFAVKAVSYEEAAPTPKVVATESVDPNKSALTPPAGDGPEARAAHAAESSAVAALANSISVPTSAPIGTPADGCPYPDTGIQALYQPVMGPAATISDRSEASSQQQAEANVRGAFSGLLGSAADKRTQQEAAAMPLLAPYKELPVGYPHTATAVPAVDPRAASPSDGAKKETLKAESAAPAVASAASPSEKPAAAIKEQTIVDAAFNLPASDTKAKAQVAQVSVNASSSAPVSNPPAHATSPQALQLNGVEAHQLTGTPLNRPKIIYHPGAIAVDSAGHKVIKPEVQVAPDSVASSQPTDVQLAQFAAGSEGTLPPPANVAPETAYPIDDEQWAAPVAGLGTGSCDKCEGGLCQHLLHVDQEDCCPSGGIGAEYVAQAPFFIQTTQPFNNCRVRLDLARDLEFPDRSEWFWAKTPGGKGPPVPKGKVPRGETTVDYQDLDFYMEKGTKRLGMAVNLPIRSVDPEIRDNATGFADMSIQTKAVLMDGKCWQLTQLFNTYLPTGSASHGTGDGHVSLEPGVAYRWKWSDITYFHGDLKYLFPIAADPDFAGQIFNYGFGWSHVAVQTDSWALIPVFEVECWTFVDGRETIPLAVVDAATGVAAFRDIDTLGIMNICPGLRWVCDKGCDCGTKEFGISAGINVTSDQTYEGLLRLEFRWSR
jgi:hypothetical protein